MVVDFLGCWLVEGMCKYLFAELEPKQLVTRGCERRELRRKEALVHEAVGTAT
jgi:manganese-transporting P-type ATPase